MPINGVQASAGKKPATPTIGTATDGGTGTTVSVAFTPSSYIGKGTITYTATSNPGSITATGSGSPITVSSLTAGTAYTFTVKGDTNYGVASDTSSASNSVTPTVPTAFDSIATFTGNGSATTYTFSSIPSTYKSLQIRFSTLLSAAGDVVNLRLNGIITTSYSAHAVQTDSGTLVAGGGGNSSFIGLFGWGAGTQSATAPVVGIVDIIDYASTSKNKTVRSFVGHNANTTVSELDMTSGALHNTSAVNSITIYSGTTFKTGTTIALYGVK